MTKRKPSVDSVVLVADGTVSERRIPLPADSLAIAAMLRRGDQPEIFGKVNWNGLHLVFYGYTTAPRRCVTNTHKFPPTFLHQGKLLGDAWIIAFEDAGLTKPTTFTPQQYGVLQKSLGMEEDTEDDTDEDTEDDNIDAVDSDDDFEEPPEDDGENDETDDDSEYESSDDELAPLPLPPPPRVTKSRRAPVAETSAVAMCEECQLEAYTYPA